MKLLGIEYGKRIFGLDILRAFAILFVVYVHGMEILKEQINIKTLRLFQFDGVTIFFVLSGFLIGRILIKHYLQGHKFDYRQLWSFWVRRWLRTLPIYFVVLTALLLLSKIAGIGTVPKYPYQYYLFIQNLWYASPGFFPEAWSLSVEEWFYLIFPLVLFLIAALTKRQSRYIFLFIAFAFLIFGVGYRYFVCMDAIEEGVKIRSIYPSHIRKVVLARVDSIMYGVLGAYLFVFNRKFWEKHMGIFFVLGMLCFYFYKAFPWGQYPFFMGMFNSSFIAWGTLLILPKLNSIEYSEKPGFLAKAFMLISLISYSMYLVNLRLLDVANIVLSRTNSPIITYIIFWAMVIITAILMYRLIEYPILKLRDKYFKKVRI